MLELVAFQRLKASRELSDRDALATERRVESASAVASAGMQVHAVRTKAAVVTDAQGSVEEREFAHAGDLCAHHRLMEFLEGTCTFQFRELLREPSCKRSKDLPSDAMLMAIHLPGYPSLCHGRPLHHFAEGKGKQLPMTTLFIAFSTRGLELAEEAFEVHGAEDRT